MAKGIIYVMTTVVPGLIKIGKTGTANFESRMYGLEHNGYSNVVGLKRYYAIEVEEYDEKEQLLQSIFSKSRLENTELFALDVNLAVQLLSSFEGKQIYPQKDKEEIFDEATAKYGNSLIPDGTYYLQRTIKKWDEVTAVMEVKNNKLVVKKGSVMCPIKGIGFSVNGAEKLRQNAHIENNTLCEDVEVTSPSAGAAFVLYTNANGWTSWKTADGKPIEIYKNKK